MIQELLAGERKISTTTTPPAEAALQQLNLRCPRCDSTNTKFCYYNNYNLTQPRHFCKTCRRYWTKGGALRNVPIGGGCRKNKISTPPGKSTSAYAKLRTSFSSLSSDITKQNFHLDPSSPPSNHANILWPPPQNSHIFALLRAAQNPNPNPNPNPNATSLWRNNQQQPNGMIPSGGEAQPNSGIQELFQRLKSSRSGGYYYGGQQPASLTSNVLESAPANGSGEFSYLNSPFSWADVAAPSAGAYP